MRSFGASLSILLAVAAVVLLGIGGFDLLRLHEEKQAREQPRVDLPPDDAPGLLPLAESGMAWFFGAAICGLGAFLLAFAARRAAEGALTNAANALEDRERRLREQARALEERLAAEDEPDDEPDPMTPEMTLDDLLAALEAGDPDHRIQTLRMIPDLAPSAAEAGPPLLAILENDDEDLPVLRAVALALVDILGDPSPAVASVARRLGNENPRIRDWAAVTLGLIGPPAAAAVDDLVPLLHDPRVGSTAAEALRRIGGERARAALEGRRTG